MAKKKAAPKAKKGETYIAKAPIRRLMKKEGADLVAAEALDICKKDKRKRVTAADVRNATR